MARFHGFFGKLSSMFGGDEHTHLTGTAGNDFLVASNAGSSIAAMAGNNVIIGGRGNDTIWGGAGNDHIFEVAGNNTIVAGKPGGIIGPIVQRRALNGNPMSGRQLPDDRFGRLGRHGLASAGTALAPGWPALII